MRGFIVCLPLLLLVACAATPYRPVNANGYGYVDRSAAADTCNVLFVANSATSLQQTRDFALLRAAEIGAAAGYRYLSVKQDKSDTIMVGSGRSGGAYAPSGSAGSTQSSAMGMGGMGMYGGGMAGYGGGNLPTGSNGGGGTPAHAALLSVLFSKGRGDDTEEISALLARLRAQYQLSDGSGP